MVTELRFVVPGRPVTWQRTNEVRGRRVTDAEQREEKRRIGWCARAALPRGWRTDLEYAICVDGYWPDRRFGDSDRLVSFTMDALEGIAYVSDRQVAKVAGGRELVDKVRPRVEVSLVVFDPARYRARAWIEIEVGAAGGVG